ncbi:ABC transporter permease [Devosia neptuniae]|jgi:ribose transport system permease protein|uniref:ABC transporter permease n=1 Tax=Devosia TaxID=46913 RepID=UPI0022AFCE3F|nr:ABC transporter permease [Devosia neptuniae]MCZ4346010.1 ABC transporter permease [Devosia neptuniae]|tara:strand:- start:69 stop:1031 length:963 start_codon:yes stop_codon:yes gene_type:complete
MFTILRRYGTLIGFAAIMTFFWVSLPDTFMTARNWLNISQQMSMLIVVAAGMTIVMVMGDFDLSVGSMASLAGVVVALLFTQDYPIWAAVSLALLVGLAGGAINGALISIIGILPFVATLATLTMLSGAAFVVSGGKTISGRAIPESFGNFAREGLALGEWGGVSVTLPNLTIVALAVVTLIWVLLEHTTFGRRLYAIGGNIEAAHLSGVAVRKLKVIAFALTGSTAALAGILYASRVASANPTQGSGLMLNAIAAVFLGSTLSEHGEPRLLFTIVGVLVLGVLDNGLTQMSVDSYVRQILVGGIIILAVSTSAYMRRLR